MSRRVVLDTSTLVSAALRVGSIPYQALVEALGAWEICASAETLTELERMLEKEKFDRYLDRASRQEFAALMRRNVHLFLVQDVAVDPPCRDAMDDRFLALAMVAEVDVLVSSDEDLLVLHPWRGIPIVTPREFLVQFKRSQDRHPRGKVAG
jgi:putative PIN family toxin of toxin-antitoxin system